MKSVIKTILVLGILLSKHEIYAQDSPVYARNFSPASDKNATPQKVVVITGARFTYALVQRWIDEYNKVNPNNQIIIESRGSNDPLKYDILAEVYEHDEPFRKNREYIHVARYAVFPVATAGSSFAKRYQEKGLTKDQIIQVFFHDIFSDKDKRKAIVEPYSVYTRLQKAGAPIVFARYFGFEQKDVKGNSVAGADTHLLKALLRDSVGVTYLPLPVIYDASTRKPTAGISVLPIDLNDNGKVNDDEKFYKTLDDVISNLETKPATEIKNTPVEYLHLSVDKKNASQEAIDFLLWVNEHGQEYLHEFGYLAPEPKRFEKDAFKAFASSRSTLK
jgi:phosphate transport system substrate-binding protein